MRLPWRNSLVIYLFLRGDRDADRNIELMLENTHRIFVFTNAT